MLRDIQLHDGRESVLYRPINDVGAMHRNRITQLTSVLCLPSIKDSAKTSVENNRACMSACAWPGLGLMMTHDQIDKNLGKGNVMFA